MRRGELYRVLLPWTRSALNPSTDCDNFGAAAMRCTHQNNRRADGTVDNDNDKCVRLSSLALAEKRRPGTHCFPLISAFNNKLSGGNAAYGKRTGERTTRADRAMYARMHT